MIMDNYFFKNGSAFDPLEFERNQNIFLDNTIDSSLYPFVIEDIMEYEERKAKLKANKKQHNNGFWAYIKSKFNKAKEQETKEESQEERQA